ncbi:zinc finger protein 572-like [Belonocnema kinseyi]|uniref:zinc finger protein 572-like n=1 Tax=Belonocnema kinseyi TaxID=2817044 RepID=UPI00143DF457|nr:zinc finger protein 572-like [Belonocnema kinseyi]
MDNENNTKPEFVSVGMEGVFIKYEPTEYESVDEENLFNKESNDLPKNKAAYSAASKFETHVNSHSNTEPFECDICKKTFKNRHNVRKHIHDHIESGGSHKCPVCAESFQNPLSLRIHMRLHLENYDNECVVCHKRFSTTSNLVRHMFSHGEKSFQCDICSKGFLKPDALANHKRIHLDEEERKLLYKCKLCDKGFIKKYKLVQHMLCHSREKPVECEICKKIFKYRTCLSKHKRLHPGQKEAQSEDNHSDQISRDEKQKVDFVLIGIKSEIADEDRNLDSRKEYVVSSSGNSKLFSVEKKPCDILNLNSEIEFQDVKIEK